MHRFEPDRARRRCPHAVPFASPALVATLVADSLGAGCSPASEPIDESRRIVVSRSTTTVINHDIPAWSGTGRPVEEASIGAAAGDESHLLDIGTEGTGPGEFRRPFYAGVRADGNLVVRDQIQRRVHVFSPAGELLDDWPSERGSRTVVAADGSVFVRGDTVIALTEDMEGTVFVKRYRLELPGARR